MYIFLAFLNSLGPMLYAHQTSPKNYENNSRQAHSIPGKIEPLPDFTAHINPRYDGVVKRVSVQMGDYVQKGQILCEIDRSSGIARYQIRSPLNGYILKRAINPGEYVNTETLAFEVSDLSRVWASFQLELSLSHHFPLGQKIEVKSLNGSAVQQAAISYRSPIINENSRTIHLVATLENKDYNWFPGLYVDAFRIED